MYFKTILEVAVMNSFFLFDAKLFRQKESYGHTIWSYFWKYFQELSRDQMV